MPKFKPVSATCDFPALEKEIIKFWKENKIFEKSLKKEAPKGEWTFLDGPPFITGLPHYGSLLSSIPKDLFPRFWTMKGYRVRRVWGWDCHGLPAENKVEEELGIKRKRDIEEKVGVGKFIDACKAYVSKTSSEWEWYVDHVGRWVDFKNAYKTMDLPYMESVMWVFKQMYERGLIYKGLRVLLYCPHCATPVSNFEVAMDADNFKDLHDPATIYKYQLKDKENTYLLAWSTTPWNKIVTPALAVNPKLTYVKVAQGDENYILAKTTLRMLTKKPYKIVGEFKGEELVGKKFIPHYDYYKVEHGKIAFVVVGGDFVTAEEGTGIVTLAAYGEEDLQALQKENIHIEMHLDEEGMVKDNVPNFAGSFYLKANDLVNKDLKQRGLIYREEDLVHTVPTCWRCSTRLYYAPGNAWYVNVQKLKAKMRETNETVSWFPKHFKHGRFLKSLESAPDWNISRNRYWGSPVPIWECQCGERFVPGSIKELEERSGRKITDLHKPDIDEVTVKCQKCGKQARRVPEVLDSWTEAGSASLAERHYPFEEGLKIEEFFPPDFIVEYTGQIRAWFYVLHVIANALNLREEGSENKLARNVLVTGVILGSDGRKMSKNYGNYPDPKEMLQKYGGDALRLYLMGSPVMHAEDILISEEHYRDQVRGLLLILWNVYNFFVTYANLDGWTKDKRVKIDPKNTKNFGEFDQFILSRLHGNMINITRALNSFDVPDAVGNAYIFIVYDLSTWYLRRIRDRVGPIAPAGKDKNEAYSVLWYILTEYAKVLSPIMPFISEQTYKNLTGEESVHLTKWPLVPDELLDEKDNNKFADFRDKVTDDILEKVMYEEGVRKIVELGLAERKKYGIMVKQPLLKLTVYNFKYLPKYKILVNTLEYLAKDELNIKSIEYKKSADKKLKVVLDTKITPKLKEAGDARELIRRIQQSRKEQNLTLADKTKIEAPSWPKSFEQRIIQGTASIAISKGSELKVTKVE